LKVTAHGALALGVYFDAFRLLEGTQLFLYSEDKSQIIGAFTSENNHPEGLFATELIRGSSFILEYVEPFFTPAAAVMHISEVAFAYRGINTVSDYGSRDFGDAGPCEVNVNCSEGQGWQDQKKGVVRISVKHGSSLYWCTGSLVNNASGDYSPYLLTADHCGFLSGEYVSASDLNQWVFYFNYEAAGCSNPAGEPVPQTMAGASLIAHGGETGNTGSDFFLILLNQKVPGRYNPYFNGWDRENSISQNGVNIHHPQGDIKKISTYLTPSVSTEWNGNGLQSHWGVTWNGTTNGHGVTEGGSSGSPLYNSDGLIIGTLTGGESTCTNLNGQDFYGKFSWHWESNGSVSASHLKEWLDPDGSGIQKLYGTYYGSITIANFTADTTVIPLGGGIAFSDLSSGNPNSWKWIFEGGTPSSSSDKNPPVIQYDTYGKYNVTLVVRNNETSDTLIKKNYIYVNPVISPNPSKGQFNVFLGKNVHEVPEIRIFNLTGEEVQFALSPGNPSDITIDLENTPSGFHIIKITSSQSTIYSKILIIK
jgi:PKD repeat protein